MSIPDYLFDKLTMPQFIILIRMYYRIKTVTGYSFGKDLLESDL